MIELHHYPSTASTIPHILLEELGVPFELRLVDRLRESHLSPEFLRLNPNGEFPVLIDGDLVLYETAAICLDLCDTHPEAALAPPVGTPGRAQFYKWLIWCSSTLQASLLAWFYPWRWVDVDNPMGAVQVRQNAQVRVEKLLVQLDSHLARNRGPWFLGEDYSALDPYVLTLCRWTRDFPERPARTFTHIRPYLQRVLERPAVQRVFRREDTPPPYI